IGDSHMEESLLNRIARHEFDNTTYLWQEPLATQAKDAEEMKRGDAHQGYARLDYLILAELATLGSPTTIGSKVSDWLKDLAGQLRKLGQRAVDRGVTFFKDAANEVGKELRDVSMKWLQGAKTEIQDLQAKVAAWQKYRDDMQKWRDSAVHEWTTW